MLSTLHELCFDTTDFLVGKVVVFVLARRFVPRQKANNFQEALDVANVHLNTKLKDLVEFAASFLHNVAHDEELFKYRCHTLGV